MRKHLWTLYAVCRNMYHIQLIKDLNLIQGGQNKYRQLN